MNLTLFKETLRDIQHQYINGNICMGDLLASIDAPSGLSIEEVVNLASLLLRWADGVHLVRISGEQFELTDLSSNKKVTL